MSHKQECAHIDLPSLALHGSGQMVVAAMRAFGAKHSKTIADVALEALDIDHEAEQCYREALVIDLKLNREPTLVEKMCQVTDARVCTANELGDLLRIRPQEMFNYLRGRVAASRRSRGIEARATHAVGVILHDTNFRLIDVIPVLFSEGEIHIPSSDILIDWRESLFIRLNTRIIE